MWLILLDQLCVLFMMLPHWHQKQMRCNSDYKCLNRPFKRCWPVKMKLPVKIKSGCWEFKKPTDSATKTCTYSSQKDQSYKMWHFYDGTWSTTLTKDGWIYYSSSSRPIASCDTPVYQHDDDDQFIYLSLNKIIGWKFLSDWHKKTLTNKIVYWCK